jgi:hypothetical protein
MRGGTAVGKVSLGRGHIFLGGFQCLSHGTCSKSDTTITEVRVIVVLRLSLLHPPCSDHVDPHQTHHLALLRLLKAPSSWPVSTLICQLRATLSPPRLLAPLCGSGSCTRPRRKAPSFLYVWPHTFPYLFPFRPPVLLFSASSPGLRRSHSGFDLCAVQDRLQEYAGVFGALLTT